MFSDLAKSRSFQAAAILLPLVGIGLVGLEAVGFQTRSSPFSAASHATDGINGMRYNALDWDAARPPEEQAALYGRPLGFELKPGAPGAA